MAMRVVNAAVGSAPDLTRHHRTGEPRASVVRVLTQDDAGTYAVYEGIIMIGENGRPVQEAAYDTVMYRGRKLNVRAASEHFTGIADRYRH